MEDTTTEPLIFTNYKSGEDLEIGTKEIKTVEFHRSELDKIPSELLDHEELENVIFNDCRFTNVQNLEKLKVFQNIVKLTLKNCNLQTIPHFPHFLHSLNLSGNSFEKGSLDSIMKLRRLESLDLSRCILQEFPLVLTKLRSLKTLNIERNANIYHLSESLENLTNLETLNMGGCGLTEFPQVLCKLKSLKTLNIKWNKKIESLPVTLENLTNLETLDMVGCGLTEFPQVLCKLKSLKKLFIGENENIQNLPVTLENLTNLETLNMVDCGLTEFPQVLCKLKSLKKLFIGGNENIQNLPVKLENLTNLETLKIYDCGLTEFPQVLCKLKSLKKLFIGANENIQNLQVALENLTNLETLNMVGCGLTEFPQVLCKLKSLKKLFIGGNENIQNLPVTLENLTNLETLDMSYCGLTEFPQVLGKLKSLKTLGIGENENIQNLPVKLENLTNLETLNMVGCGLTEFPQVLGKLKSLKKLFIGENENIQNLPVTLENLTNLETLNMVGCSLTEFPQVLCKLKSLKVLDISGYPNIRSLPSTLEDLTRVKTLDLSGCGLTEFPPVLCKLKSLQNLNISRNPLKELSTSIFEIKWLHSLNVSGTYITCLPRSIERCEHLEELNISATLINEFPTVIFKMINLRNVEAKYVEIKVLDEDFVKLWSQRPEIFTEGRFQKVVGFLTVHFMKPPNEIVQRGPEACSKYYRALRADDAVNCSILNVTVMGKTGAGKSSLIQSIKEGSSVLIHPSDRTVVVDTLEVKYEDILLKIADFGGHDIYEITCPLFLKSSKQVAIVAVKLQEYGESNHDELVTKWLTTAASHMKSGNIAIVATQCDLCTQDEVTEKMKILEKKVHNWFQEELSFTTKICKPTLARKSALSDKNIHYFQTSSLNMEGMEDTKEFLFRGAKLNISVLPKRWADVYIKMDELADKNTNFITKSRYQTLFRKSMAFPRNVFRHTEESLQCLQFLHDSGMVLWYGEKHEELRKIIFHNPSFPVLLLQGLFRHNLVEVLVYDHEQFGRYFTYKSNFQDEVTRFTQTGILNTLLLRYIWKEFNFSQEVFDTMVEMLTMLDLCYKDGESPDSMLRLPWFIQDENMDLIKDLWPEKLPSNTLQYTLTYCFCHRIPGVIYERFCVRLQRHLQAGAHTRQDRRNAVYIEQNAVQILFQRHPFELEPYMQIHLRCSIDNLLQLQQLCLDLHKDMDNLCNEYSGLYIDCYLLCPHCLLIGSTAPTKRSAMTVEEKVSLEWVPCDPSTPGSVQIPAALIFLSLLGRFLSIS